MWERSVTANGPCQASLAFQARFAVKDRSHSGAVERAALCAPGAALEGLPLVVSPSLLCRRVAAPEGRHNGVWPPGNGQEISLLPAMSR